MMAALACSCSTVTAVCAPAWWGHAFLFSRHFDVAFGGTLELERVHLINGCAQASGGAVKVRHGGTLIATESSVEDSSVVSLDSAAYGGAIDASNEMAIDKVLEKLDAHSDNIYSVVYSPDGSRIATVGGDSALRVWTPRTCPRRCWRS